MVVKAGKPATYAGQEAFTVRLDVGVHQARRRQFGVADGVRHWR